MDTFESVELEKLMSEFPDWKLQYPDIYTQLNPPRYSKNRGPPQVTQSWDPSHKRATNVPVTDYQATYARKHGERYRPRSNKRPPPTPLDPNPPPMSFDTWQRSTYTPKDLSGRAKLVQMQSDRYVAPSEPFHSQTDYQMQFAGGYNLPELHIRPPPKSKMPNSTAKMQSITTSKEHFQKWQRDPAITFRDPPSFTGSILYPHRAEKLPESTNQDTYKYQYSARPDLAKLSGVNIKYEGAMDLNTVTQMTYKNFEGAEPARKITHDSVLPPENKSKFIGETQAMRDFPGYKGCQPRPAQPSVPAPTTIDLKYDDNTFYKTEMQKEFIGIDTTKHHVAKLAKKEDEYKPPSAKFDGLTNQKNDYREYDLKDAYVGLAKPPQSKIHTSSQPKLDDTTTNKVFFKKYDVKPRVRYGDFHEGHKYIPPADKFDVVSTNQDVYKVPHNPSIPPSFKPDDKPVASTGPQDFNTVYRNCYTQVTESQKLNPDKAKFLLKELRTRKTQKVGVEQHVHEGVKTRGQPITAN